MAAPRILIEAGPAETRAALIAGGRVRRLLIGPAHGEPLPPVAGERLRAVVRSIDTRLGAAFCALPDIADGEGGGQGGGEGEGFLPLPPKQRLSEGETVIVDVARAPGEGKLAQLRLSADQRPPQAARPGVAVHAVAQLGGDETGGDAATEILFTGDFEAQTQLSTALPSARLTPRGPELFEREGAEAALEQALTRTVTLASGARLTIDEAEALTAIDIDVSAMAGQSRHGAAQRACLSAIPAIMDEILLRRIGGQVVLDFPLSRRQAGDIEAALAGALGAIPGARPVRLAQGGLAALSLPKTGPSLLASVTEPGRDAPIAGRRYTRRHLAARALRAAERAMPQAGGGPVVLHVPGQIADHLETRHNWTAYLSARWANRLTLMRANDRERDWYDVVTSP